MKFNRENGFERYLIVYGNDEDEYSMDVRVKKENLIKEIVDIIKNYKDFEWDYITYKKVES